MSSHKSIDRICCIVLALVLMVTALLFHAEALGVTVNQTVMGYETRLFDTDRVHTIEIVMDNWDSFIETCENEEYANCAVVIDNEAYKNVGIRAKGNTSLSSVSSMNSERYSFKIEFDQYDNTKTYHGLDKLSLNNVIQDNTYMKDYLTYQMMAAYGVAAPLCSFVYITVNGEDWGLYLAVEGIEDAFLRRNYGSSYGELYKPDSMSMGGGRGNGKNFDMSDFMSSFSSEKTSGSEETKSSSRRSSSSNTENTAPSVGSFGTEGGMPDFGSFGTEGSMPDFGSFGTDGSMPSIGSSDTGSTAPSFDFSNMFGGSGGFGGMSFGMGSGDVKLQYIDDNPSSYSSIFGNAKTDVTDADMDRLIESLKLLSEGKNIEKVVDVDEVLRYFVVHNFVCNGDSYTGSIIHNYYLYEENGQMSMIPWDYNLAFGTFQGNDASGQVNDPIDSPMSVSGSDRPMIDWIWSSEEYRSMYHSYFAEFLDTVDIVGMIDHAYALIKPYVEKDPGKFCTTEAFELGVSTLREFCTLREESVRGQLAGTIPSTDAGQQQDRSALVDASHLNLSAMGSMGGGMGGMGGRGENSRPESGEGSENTSRPGRTPTSDKSNVPPASPENSATSAPQMTPTSAIGSGSAFPSALNGSVIGLAAETTANQNIPQMPSGMTPPTGEMPSGSIPADGEMPGGGSFPNFGSMPSESMPANGDGSFPSEGSFPNMGQIPGFSSGEQGSGSQRPSGMGSFGESNFGGAGYGNAMTGNNTTMLLAVSVIVLAVGLLVALLFKPRSW